MLVDCATGKTYEAGDTSDNVIFNTMFVRDTFLSLLSDQAQAEMSFMTANDKLAAYFKKKGKTKKRMRDGVFVFDHLSKRFWFCWRDKNGSWSFRCYDDVVTIEDET